jgi:hypothetical protein
VGDWGIPIILGEAVERDHSGRRSLQGRDMVEVVLQALVSQSA